MRRCVSFFVALYVLALHTFAAEATAVRIMLPARAGALDSWFCKDVELPAGKLHHAWTMLSAGHEYVLFVNGKEASRSRYGRVASAFRLAEEVEDLAPFLTPGAVNALCVKAHVWSEGTPETPTVPYVRIEGTVEYEDGRSVALATDASWAGSCEGPVRGKLRPAETQPVVADRDPNAGRLPPRMPRDKLAVLAPEVPAPLPPCVRAAFPAIVEMSDWRQQVVFRDAAKEAERLRAVFPSKAVAERYAQFVAAPPTNMGDSYSINVYSVGNGWVWTAMGSYPFHNTNVVAGPEYQYPIQWNPGSTFLGDDLRIVIDGKEAALPNQWMWKIRGTDVVVTAATDARGELVFYTLTFAPPELKALCRIYAVANNGAAPCASFKVRHMIARTKVAGATLTETVTHPEMKAGAANTRAMLAGVYDEGGAVAEVPPEGNGALIVDFGAVAPGAVVRRLVYRAMALTSVGGAPIASDMDATLAAIARRNYALLDDTIAYWRAYNAATTSLEAPGAWGRRIADFIDDEKMLVQTQQFARTGAVGPMWFFSDQWIRDACGPIKSFLATGKAENARRAIDYFYIGAVANRIVLNWVGMDIDIEKAWPPVADWNDVSVHAGGGDHVSAEVPSWLILQHYWYWKQTGDAASIAAHWDYLRRLFFGQFDNAKDKIFRPDFKIPFHGDETFIYSGGEALWENRYDLRQTSYPGGNIYSADSSFELVAAGEALVAMGRAAGKDVADIAAVTPRIREATEKYYWQDDLGFYAQGMSVLHDGQLNRYPMANIMANVTWCGYGTREDKKTVSNAVRMLEYLAEDTGVFNPIVGYDVSVGMLQGQCLHTLAAIDHPWAEKAFHALLMIAGETTEYSEWMAPGRDFRTMYRANRLRPWEGGINLDAALYYLSGLEPDAPARKMTLTPRLPTGVYSPIAWDSMRLRNLPLGTGSFTLDVKDDGKGWRTYALASALKERVDVTVRCLVPFGAIRTVEVAGAPVQIQQPKDVFEQSLSVVEVLLAPGATVTVAAVYTPRARTPLAVELKDFEAPGKTFAPSDVVYFGATPPVQNEKTLAKELAKKLRVTAVDATLPTDPATFAAALLTDEGLRARMLILGPGTLSSRKATFFCSPEFDAIMGRFLARGGVLLETDSGIASSRWLARTLEGASFEVETAATGFAVAMDAPDEAMDRTYRWLQEMNVGEAGKWSAYWEGWFAMPYREGGAVIRDHFFVWGEQEQPHGAMQFTMKSTPGKDHLVRVRTSPGTPKRGLILQTTEDEGKTWVDQQTVWIPAPEEGKRGWVDVDLTLPGKCVNGATVTFRLKAPKGSYGGIGYEPERLASTGAARIWIRHDLTSPPPMSGIATTNARAAALGLPAKGVAGYSQGRIRARGMESVYRILGDSAASALVMKKVGAGTYVKSEVVIEESFPVETMARFVQSLLGGVGGADQPRAYAPGARTLLDAHNCYPYEGVWADRIDRALATGVPVAIEEDLIWDAKTTPGSGRIVVRHGGTAAGNEPTLEAYLFEKVRPVVEKALREGDRAKWPLVTLNINDLRASEPEFFAALWALMGKYESWLCTAPKAADVAQVAPLDVKPILVLTSDGARQAKVFYEDVPVGGRLRMFAAGRPDRNADNFRRWVNYAWKDVEPGGQAKAGEWSAEDAARLKTLVDNAHRRGYWIRFYTLNGHGAGDTALRGWSPGYNFGSLEAVTLRWNAAKAAGVDFVASDQYEDCAKALRKE